MHDQSPLVLARYQVSPEIGEKGRSDHRFSKHEEIASDMAIHLEAVRDSPEVAVDLPHRSKRVGQRRERSVHAVIAEHEFVVVAPLGRRFESRLPAPEVVGKVQPNERENPRA